MKISKLIAFILSLPKTIFFNLSAFPINKAIKLPVFISYRTHIIEVHRGIIHFSNTIRPFMVRIGEGGSPSLPTQKSSIRLQTGKLLFKGRANMGAGTIINVKGNMTIGSGFSTNKNCFLSCTNEVNIGENVLLGWNCHIFDDNGGHHVYYEGKEKKRDTNDYAINIGDHTWLCSYSHILAGASIGKESILAYKSLLTTKISEDNVLVAGLPAIIKARNINWTI